MSVTDVVSLIAISFLLASIFMRLRPKSGKTYAPLFWVQVSIIVMLALSLSWTYPALDASLGGQNYMNLILHLIFIGSSWVYTKVLAEPFFRGATQPVALRLWVPITAAIGSALSFTILDSQGTSRGLEALTNQPAWIGYWVFNIMTLWAPSFVIVPRLLEAVNKTRVRPLRIAYWAMIVGYSASVLAVLGYIATFFDPTLIVVREMLVLLTELGLIVALIAIPVLSHQQCPEQSARQKAQQEAAARFNR